MGHDLIMMIQLRQLSAARFNFDFVQTCASVSVHNFQHFLQEYDTLTEPEIKALYYAQM